MSEPAPEQPRPWYREPWPWVLIAIPLSGVLGGIATVWIAAETSDGLVVDDYYRQGLAINRVLERERRARELGVGAQVLFAGGRVRVVLRGAAPPKIRLRLLHPTREGHDRELLLAGSGGVYEAALDGLVPASWHVQLEPDDRSWVLKGRVRLPAPEAVLSLGAHSAAAAG